jgi:hypothetical protein
MMRSTPQLSLSMRACSEPENNPNIFCTIEEAELIKTRKGIPK